MLFPEELNVASNSRVSRRNSSSLHIEWSPPFNHGYFNGEMRYKVLYKVYRDRISKTDTPALEGDKESWLNKPEITINGLQENTTYEATFRIVSSISEEGKESITNKCNLHIGPKLKGKCTY